MPQTKLSDHIPSHPTLNKWSRAAHGDFSPIPGRPKLPAQPSVPPVKNKYVQILDELGETFSPLEAAYVVGDGRIYELNIPVDREPRFFVIGCQGNGHDAQKEVAKLMDHIAKDPNNKPDFILIAGDNFYDDGISSPEDPIIKKNFTDIYENPVLTHIAGIPCFAILGNHDENIHHLRRPWDSKGPKRGMFQVARSYIAEKVHAATDRIEKYFSRKDKRELYQQKKLDLKAIPKWNMPGRYYSLIAGNTQIFCIDSNTYVDDYLEYQTSTKVDSKNQAFWLEQEITRAKSEGRKVILTAHHPIMTPGKRSFHSDANLYLEKIKQKIFERIYKKFYATTTKQTISANKESYNTLLRETFKMQWKTQQVQGKDFSFDTIFAAHDHDLYYINNNNHRQPDDFPVCEIVSGGGGGCLQNLMKYDDHLAFFMKQNGFVVCDQYEGSFGESILRYHVHTTRARDREHHLVFTEKSTEPVRDYSTLNNAEAKAVKHFCDIVRAAIDDYLKFITQKQQQHHGKFFTRNLSHGESGVENAHKLWAYVSNHEVDDLATTIDTVYQMTKWKGIFTSPNEHSLTTILNRKVKDEYRGRGLEELSKTSRQHAVRLH